MKRFDIHRGLDIAHSAVRGHVERARARRVALIGQDYQGLRPRFHCQVGDEVALGDIVMTDRRYPQLCFTAPGSGRVAAIHLGARRGLDALVIDLEEEHDECASPWGIQDDPDAAAVRATLLACGLWPALRSRPYDLMPLPDASADCLFITAIDTHPLSPDPGALIAEHAEAFAVGVDKLRLLTPRTYVCAAAAEVVESLSGVTQVVLTGPHPAGLPGTQLQLLAPQATSAWYIGYQDVLAIGRLYLSGRLSFSRLVSLAGSDAAAPRLLRTRSGAAIADLDEAVDPQTLSPGSPLGEKRTALARQFLGRFDNQVWIDAPALPESGDSARWRSWLNVVAKPRQAAVLDDNQSGTGMLTVEAFDEVWPLGMPPAPLLRALLSGDTETARSLGVAMLGPDDLALCSYVCPAKQDYGWALREIHREMVQEET